MNELTLPPQESRTRPGVCDLCNGSLIADDRSPRNLGLCADAGCHNRCKGCGHEQWEHSPSGCLHTDFVGDYGEYNDDCACVLKITDAPYGTHTNEHYEYEPAVV